MSKSQPLLSDAEIVAICEETRWLGDLYQAAFNSDPKGPVKLNALVQTPDFVGTFLLDRTMDPAVQEFGLPGFRMIDPTCGTGHILLQALGKMFKFWQAKEPDKPAEYLVRQAMSAVHGVDCDPFAVHLAKLRLLRAALRLSGRDSMPTEPFPINAVWADSLLPAEHEMQPFALMAEVRRLRKLCDGGGIMWKDANHADSKI